MATDGVELVTLKDIVIGEYNFDKAFPDSHQQKTRNFHEFLRQGEKKGTVPPRYPKAFHGRWEWRKTPDLDLSTVRSTFIEKFPEVVGGSKVRPVPKKKNAAADAPCDPDAPAALSAAAVAMPASASPAAPPKSKMRSKAKSMVMAQAQGRADIGGGRNGAQGGASRHRDAGNFTTYNPPAQDANRWAPASRREVAYVLLAHGVPDDRLLSVLQCSQEMLDFYKKDWARTFRHSARMPPAKRLNKKLEEFYRATSGKSASTVNDGEANDDTFE